MEERAMASELQELREAVVQGADALVRAGVLSASQHGNWSIRIPGTDRFLLSGSALAGIRPEDLAVLGLDGEVVDGGLSASSAEIIKMHACVYLERPGVGSVVHTHSPYSTAFAVASRDLECFSEALARTGTTEPVPVAKYGPRGSDQAITNIVEALQRSPNQQAVLLENHGILCFGPDVTTAQRMVFALEETAQLAILASAIGTPRALTAEMGQQTQQRAREFAARGTVTGRQG